MTKQSFEKERAEKKSLQKETEMTKALEGEATVSKESWLGDEAHYSLAREIQLRGNQKPHGRHACVHQHPRAGKTACFLNSPS